MLDGGLTAWRAESGPLEQGPSALEPTDFAATERPGFFVDQSEVLAIVEGRARGRLVCVLRPEVFAGTEQRYSRPGHIPLSVNLPYVELLGPDDRFLPERALRKALAPLFSGDERLILYCGGAVTAAGTACSYPSRRSRHLDLRRLPFRVVSQPQPANGRGLRFYLQGEQVGMKVLWYLNLADGKYHGLRTASIPSTSIAIAGSRGRLIVLDSLAPSSRLGLTIPLFRLPSPRATPSGCVSLSLFMRG